MFQKSGILKCIQSILKGIPGGKGQSNNILRWLSQSWMNSLPDKQNPAPAFFSPRKLWHPLPWALSLLQQQPAVFLFPGDKHSSGKGAELPVKWVKRGMKHPPQDAPRQGFSRPPQPPRFPYKIRKQKRAAITAHSCTDGHNKEGFSQQGLWLGWMWGRVFSNS